MKSIASERLQETLSYWLDLCWVAESLDRTEATAYKRDLSPVPLLTNWKRFEQTVFDTSVEKLSIRDWQVPESVAEVFRGLDPLSYFPLEFFEWSRKSRRIYHLPTRLSTIFGMATYPEIRWKDVLWPFDSFVITLESPIQIEEELSGWKKYDTILVTKIPEINQVRIRLFRETSVNPEGWRITRETKEKFEKFLKQRRFKKAVNLLKSAYKQVTHGPVSSPGWRSTRLMDMKVNQESKVQLETKDFIQLLTTEQQRELTKGSEHPLEYYLWRLEPNSWAAKIVIGWCLYLRRLAPSRTEWSSHEIQRLVRGTRGVTGVITNIDYICTVLGEAKMDLSVHAAGQIKEQASGFFKRPHWRRAHDQRLRSGEVVEIPPLLIREDLVPYFGVIGGTKTQVLEDE